MSLGKSKILSQGAAGGVVGTDNFNTVTYTGNGGTQKIGGYINRAAVFNGSSSKIVLPTSTFSPSTFTLSAWCNVTSDTDENTILELLDNQSYPNHTNIVLSAGSTGTSSRFLFRNYLANQYDYSPTGTVQKNVWKHYAMTYDGSTVKSYINGSLVDSASFTLSNTVGTISSIQLGLSSGNRYLNGKIDQVRIFNKALSSSEVTTLYGETSASASKEITDIFSDSSAVALYQLDGNANDTGGVSGKFGEAAMFNGSSSYINNGFIPSLITQTFTISAWVKFSTLTDNQAFISNYVSSGGTSRGWFLRYQISNGIQFGFRNSTTDVSLSNNYQPTINEWVHVCVSVSASSKTLYINGASNATLGADNIIYLGNQETYLGRLGILSLQYFGGSIDQVRVYSDVLTSTEVGYLYNNTTASIPTDNLEAYYKLDGNATDETGSHNGTATNVSYAYNGTATNVTYQDATNFTPDFVWIKARSIVSSHNIFDSIRGNKRIVTNSTNAEVDLNPYAPYGLTSFNSNGFTIGDNYNGDYALNGDPSGTYGSSQGYVAWCWKGGGAASSNGSGSITSDVSANQAAGFSIVKYQANATQGATIGHGLSSPPEMIITKELTGPRVWCVYHKDLTSSDYYLELNTTNSEINSLGTAYAGVPNSSTYSVGTSSLTNDPATDSYIAYCFHSVTGYQKIGSYTGNGSTTGTSVTTGFEPRFLLIKKTTQADNWTILDKARTPNNPMENDLKANSAAAEQTNTGNNYPQATTSATGFQVNTTDGAVNTSGQTYIYLAIA